MNKVVTISEIEERVAKNGKPFLVAKLTGEAAIHTSASGRQYLASLKAEVYLNDTTKEIAEQMIGHEITGEIVKETVPEYTFTGRDGKMVKCDYRYVFRQTA